MAVATNLADKSALARIGHEAVGRRLGPMIEAGLVGTCGDRDVDMEGVPDLLPALARAFARQAERALEQGLLQGYVEIDDSVMVLRGRLREQDQLRQRFGLALPLLVRFDDYTVDITENQLLRGATELLLRLPGWTRRPAPVACLNDLAMTIAEAEGSGAYWVVTALDVRASWIVTTTTQSSSARCR